MENLIISKSICPSVSYDTRNDQLQPRGFVTARAVWGCGSPQLPGTPCAPALDTSLRGWAGRTFLGWQSAESVLELDRTRPTRLVLLVSSLGSAPAPCQAPSWLHPSASRAQELQGRALPVPPPRHRDWHWGLGLPAPACIGRSCLGIAQAGLCAKWRPVQPCAVML